MLCPRCFEDRHSVINTGSSNEFIYRTRLCKICGMRWVTVEIDLDRAGKEYESGDGYENNSRKLNELLHLRKGNTEKQ